MINANMLKLSRYQTFEQYGVSVQLIFMNQQYNCLHYSKITFTSCQ